MSAKLYPGAQFGKLTVLERLPNRKGNPMLKCKCECGNESVVQGSNLTTGHTRSCGCIQIKHSQSYTREYKTWIAIKRRCCDPNNCGYPRYGAVGIKICDKWINDFPAFYADMGPKPTPKHSIDRKDNDGNYEPGNCRWATTAEQARNKRNNHFFEFNGKRQTLPDWSREVGISHSTLINRIYKYGWTPEMAFTTPIEDQLASHRPVTQLCVATGRELQRWPSVIVAAQHYGIMKRGIRRAAEGARQTAGGFRWQYTHPTNSSLWEKQTNTSA